MNLLPLFPKAKKMAAVTTALSVLLAVPGPWAYQACAQVLSGSASGAAGFSGASAGAALHSGAAAANGLQAPVGISAEGMLRVPSASAFAAAPSLGSAAALPVAPALAGAAASPAAPRAASADSAAVAPVAASAAGSPLTGSVLAASAEGRRDSKAAVSGTPAAALAAKLAVAAPGAFAAAADGLRPGDNKSAVDADESGVCAPPAECPFHKLFKPSKALGADAAEYAGPTSAKIPFSLGKAANLRHKIGQWIIYKTHMEGETGYWTLPKQVGVWVIYSMILSLRKINGFSRRYLTNEAAPIPFDKKLDTQPSPNGDWMDPADPRAGSAGLPKGSLFGPEYIKPRPTNKEQLIKIGVELFTRNKGTVYAPFLNQHFGAWIQAMVEGWFGSEFDHATPIKIALPPGYKWHGDEMTVLSSQQALNKKEGVAENVFTNVESPQWMARHLYGKSKEDQDKLRSFDGFGRVKVEDEHLPVDASFAGGVPQVGQPRNMWIGRSLHDNIFLAHNHNFVADRLFRYYTEGPNFEQLGWGFFARLMWRVFDRKQYLVEKAAFDKMSRAEKDDFLFHKTWLINAATIIAIHTVDWTPELLPNPVTFYGMHVEYSGILGAKIKYAWFDKQWAHKAFGWAINTDLLSGIPGSKVQRFSSTYELDETFVNAYRIRELVRDMIRVYELRTGKKLADMEVGKAQGVQTQAALTAFRLVDQHYSHGLAFPGDSGALNNVAHFFENLNRMDGLGFSDMRMMDVLRERERGEPAYTKYREALRLPVPKDFMELTGGNEELAERLASLYKTVDEVDTHVGKRAHPRPWGTVLSVDQFHIFGKYAPWRQLAYRLLSADFGPAIYTPVGVQEVLGASLKKMYLRFYPEMAAALDGPRSAFNPMNRIHPETAAAGKTLQQTHDEEVELGIVTHNLDRLAVFGPLARRTLFGNSSAGSLPARSAEGRAIVQPVNWLGRRLSGSISSAWQGRSLDQASGKRLSVEPSAFDAKPAITVTRRGSLVVDEVRQVGPSVYVGRTYLSLPLLPKIHIADFAVEYAPAPDTAKLMDDARTASFAQGAAGKNYFWANAAITAAALIFTAFSWHAAIPMLLFPLATAVLSWSNRRKATLGFEYASRNAPTAHKTVGSLIHTTFEAQDSAKKAARWDKFAAFGVMDGALMIAWHMLAAHPIVAIVVAAVGLKTGFSTLDANKSFLASADALKTSVYGALIRKTAKRGAADLPGDSGIEKHYRYLSGGEPNATPLKTFLSLKALGYSAKTAFMTTLTSHLLFSGKTRKNMTVEEKANDGTPFLGIFLPRIADAYDAHGTSVYAREAKTLKDGTSIRRGDVDTDVLDAWFTADRDYVTRADMNAFFEAGVAARNIPWWNLKAKLGVAFGRMAFGRRMDQLFEVFPDRVVYRGGKPEKAVSKTQLTYFFQGGLQYDLARQRAANDNSSGN
ncbi:MAG: peroxidase family protein [Elusimicrobiota bacterium]